MSAATPIQSSGLTSLLKARSITAATAAASTPDTIAGSALKFWVKADSLSLNDGDLVATWADQSGNGADLSEATNKPTYKTAIINSKPVVRFDGSNDVLKTTGTHYTTDMFTTTAFCVWWVGRVITSTSDSSGADNNAPFWTDDGNSNFGMSTRVSGAGYFTWGYAGGIKTTTDTLANNTPAIMHMRFDTGNLVATKNGGADITTSLGGNSLALTANLNLAIAKGAPAAWAHIDMAELIICNSALDSGKRAAMLSYLNTKWAVF